jgi:hypothetical protein
MSTHARNELAIPEPIAEAPATALVDDVAHVCAFACGEPIDLDKPLAWSKSGQWVAHLKCYDAAWFTVGVADGVSSAGLPAGALGAEASS